MDFHGCGILKSVLRESMRLIRLLGNWLICWKWLLGWAYYSCWLFDTYESICYATWPEDPDTARNQRNLIATDGQNSRPFTKIQLPFHWRRDKRLCRRALLRNGQCIGLDPAITLRPKYNECNSCAIVSSRGIMSALYVMYLLCEYT